MKDSVQYKDYVGECAADISDFKNLVDILKEWGVDIDRYYPVGVTFSSGDYGYCSLAILCNDTKSINGGVVMVCYDRDPGYTALDIQAMFKRFHATIVTEGLNLCDMEVSKEIHVE